MPYAIARRVLGMASTADRLGAEPADEHDLKVDGALLLFFDIPRAARPKRLS